jgi:hypothetical protein
VQELHVQERKKKRNAEELTIEDAENFIAQEESENLTEKNTEKNTKSLTKKIEKL